MTDPAVAAVGLWLLVGLVGYALGAAALLFYYPSADRLPNGTVTDVVFVATLPLVLAVTVLASLRR